jgi:hypothetical protein
MVTQAREVSMIAGMDADDHALSRLDLALEAE